MISLINAARVARHMPPVGWFNRRLYANATLFCKDIVSGDNKCTAVDSTSGQATCCPQGNRDVYFPSIHSISVFSSCICISFYRFFSLYVCMYVCVHVCVSGFVAQNGWDPVSGWGSIHFPSLFSVLVLNTADGWVYSTSAASVSFRCRGLYTLEGVGVIGVSVIGVMISTLFISLLSLSR